MSRLALMEPHAATIDRLTRERDALREALQAALPWVAVATASDGIFGHPPHPQRTKNHAADLAKVQAALALCATPDDHPVPWSGSPGYSGEKCGPVSDADPLPWESSGPPDAAHAAADAAMFLDDGDYEE